MAKRCIYFVRNNQLFKRTVDVEWDMNNFDYDIEECDKSIKTVILPFMEPCINVSTGSKIYRNRMFATGFVRDSHGDSITSVWKKLNSSIDAEFIPPGAHDLLYITSLGEGQVYYALSQASFYDTFHNPDKQMTCSAKALASLQLLCRQGKADYIEDMNKFLWWYWVNCQCPMEYNAIYDK